MLGQFKRDRSTVVRCPTNFRGTVGVANWSEIDLELGRVAIARIMFALGVVWLAADVLSFFVTISATPGKTIGILSQCRYCDFTDIVIVWQITDTISCSNR